MQNATIFCLCLHNKVLPIIKKLEYIEFENKFFENKIDFLNEKNILHPIYISDNKLFD